MSTVAENLVGVDYPYPGLRPFHTGEAQIFFGRDAHVLELATKLEENRFLAVVGASGCGKSSLVNAGLIPRLETGLIPSAGFKWLFARMRPEDRPLRNLAHALYATTSLFSPETGVTDDEASDDSREQAYIEATLRRGPLGLVDLISVSEIGHGQNLMVVVDQFEEVFRFERHGNANEARQFVSLLIQSAAEAKKHGIPLHVILTMRSDFLGNCPVFSGLPEALNDSQYLTPRLTRDQITLAIEGPAAQLEATVEPRLVNHILNQMGTDPDQLPVMQHLLMRMWNQCDGNNTLTFADYQRAGEFSGALSEHGDEVYGKLSKEQKRIAEVLFKGLTEVTPDGNYIRRPAIVSEIAAVANVNAQEVIAVANEFRAEVCSFLTPLHKRRLTADSLIDISHESLIRQWSRVKTWAQDEAKAARKYHRLIESAVDWKSRQGPLLTRQSLESALHWKNTENPTQAWARRYNDEFPLGMQFLRASVDKRKRDLLLLVVVLTIVSVILIAATVFLIQRNIERGRVQRVQSAWEEANSLTRDFVIAAAERRWTGETRDSLRNKAAAYNKHFVHVMRLDTRYNDQVADAHLRLGFIRWSEDNLEDAKQHFADFLKCAKNAQAEPVLKLVNQGLEWTSLEAWFKTGDTNGKDILSWLNQSLKELLNGVSSDNADVELVHVEMISEILTNEFVTDQTLKRIQSNPFWMALARTVRGYKFHSDLWERSQKGEDMPSIAEKAVKEYTAALEQIDKLPDDVRTRFSFRKIKASVEFNLIDKNLATYVNNRADVEQLVTTAKEFELLAIYADDDDKLWQYSAWANYRLAKIYETEEKRVEAGNAFYRAALAWARVPATKIPANFRGQYASALEESSNRELSLAFLERAIPYRDGEQAAEDYWDAATLCLELVQEAMEKDELDMQGVSNYLAEFFRFLKGALKISNIEEQQSSLRNAFLTAFMQSTIAEDNLFREFEDNIKRSLGKDTKDGGAASRNLHLELSRTAVRRKLQGIDLERTIDHLVRAYRIFQKKLAEDDREMLDEMILHALDRAVPAGEIDAS